MMNPRLQIVLAWLFVPAATIGVLLGAIFEGFLFGLKIARETWGR